MSYILDALRRADSERERERTAVPGLHAQPVAVGAPDAEIEPRTRLWPWFIAAAFALLLGWVAWLLLARTEPAAIAPAAAAAPAASALPVAGGAPTAAALATATAPAAPATAAAVSALASAATAAPAAAAASPSPARQPAAAARKPPAGDVAAASRKPAVAAGAAPAAAAAKLGAKAEPAAKASEAQGRVYALSELPDEIRRELPKPVIGGSIYSKSAANRMLVINGQVFHEGDELAPALSLDQIGPKAAILKFKGFRYEITY